MQAALGAGRGEDASEALQRWEESSSGRPDAAMVLGAGGRMSAADLEGLLKVIEQTSAY